MKQKEKPKRERQLRVKKLCTRERASVKSGETIEKEEIMRERERERQRSLQS